MTMPNQPAPDGAYVIGGGEFKYGQNLTETVGYSMMTGGTAAKIGAARGVHKTEVDDRIDLTYAVALEAQGHADQAVTEAEAAANAAAAAGQKADIAYENAHYWSVECVVASAAVVLGVNELHLGPVLNVPDGLDARLTDAHFAFVTQPGGCTIEIKRWDESGTVADVIHTQVLGANVTRYNANVLDIPAFDKERFFYNVTNVVGSVAPLVLQINVSGVYIPEP